MFCASESDRRRRFDRSERGISLAIDDSKTSLRKVVLPGSIKAGYALPHSPKPDQLVMLRLTIPDKDNLYADLIKHKNVLRVVALSGGYSRDESNKRLARNNGMTASFSRALSEGLTAQQSDGQFNAALDGSVESI